MQYRNISVTRIMKLIIYLKCFKSDNHSVALVLLDNYVIGLQDSGGFQMVSLLKFAHITEEGVNFRSPHDDSEMMLTPEHSVHIQNIIGKLFFYLIPVDYYIIEMFENREV